MFYARGIKLLLIFSQVDYSEIHNWSLCDSLVLEPDDNMMRIHWLIATYKELTLLYQKKYKELWCMLLQRNQKVMSNTTFQFTTRDEIYAILTVCSSSLSIFGGVGIIIIYVYFKDLRTCGRKLLVYLSLMDALTAFGNILGVVWLLCRAGTTCRSVYESMEFCRLHASLTIFSSISSFLWMVIIGVSLLKSIIWNMPSFARRYMKVFYIIAWPIPG